MHNHEPLTHVLVLRISNANASDSDLNCIRRTAIASHRFMMYVIDIHRDICGDTHVVSPERAPVEKSAPRASNGHNLSAVL